MQPSAKVLFVFTCQKCGHLLKTTYIGYKGECPLCKGKMIPMFSQLATKQGGEKDAKGN